MHSLSFHKHPHSVKRMSKIYKSSALTSQDTVRLPSCVNGLGEYLASISEQLREYGGNRITAYSLSSLEQYVPLFLNETVRIVAEGEERLYNGSKITHSGVLALDRSCSVLYRDLKGATTFDNSFWDEDVAADAFERAASFVTLMDHNEDEVGSGFIAVLLLVTVHLLSILRTRAIFTPQLTDTFLVFQHVNCSNL